MKRASIFHNQRNVLFALFIALLPLGAFFKSDAQVQKIEPPASNSYYTSWLNEDVVWIIKDQERAAFNLLQSDEERDRFIDAFWMRRNPHPDQLGNVLEDEHYRRISYANEHFEEADIPGWQSDRGRMYIKYGPPDKIISFAAGKAGPPPFDKELHTAFPKEIWEYLHSKNLGTNTKVGFVDSCMCEDYRVVNKSEIKIDANSSLNTDKPELIALETLESSPQTKYKNLEEIVSHNIHYDFLLPLAVTKTYSKVTDATSLATIEIKVNQGQPQTSQEEATPIKKLIVFGRITSIGGRIVREFDDSLDIHDESSTGYNVEQPAFKEIVPLRPGKYRLSIAVEDVASKKIGTWDRVMIVPE